MKNAQFLPKTPKNATKPKFSKKIYVFAGFIADKYKSSEGPKISDFRPYWCHVKTKKFEKKKKMYLEVL